MHEIMSKRMNHDMRCIYTFILFRGCWHDLVYACTCCEDRAKTRLTPVVLSKYPTNNIFAVFVFHFLSSLTQKKTPTLF